MVINWNLLLRCFYLFPSCGYHSCGGWLVILLLARKINKGENAKNHYRRQQQILQGRIENHPVEYRKRKNRWGG
jgi:hypothetical protein